MIQPRSIVLSGALALAGCYSKVEDAGYGQNSYFQDTYFQDDTYCTETVKYREENTYLIGGFRLERRFMDTTVIDRKCVRAVDPFLDDLMMLNGVTHL